MNPKGKKINDLITYDSEVVSLKPLKVIDPESQEPVKTKNKPIVELNQKVKITKIVEDVWILI